MTIVYQDQAHLDTGLEWGQMYYLEYASPEMQWMGGAAASVKRVLVARRKIRRGRQGSWTRFFVRLSDREYGPSSYFHVLDHTHGYGDQLFLTEADAWDAYVGWLQRYLDRLRDKLKTGEQMLVESEAIARLRKTGGSTT